ncbi:hypothetical protein EMIT0158MI4_20413 [Burkholderia ambifaria]
MAACARPVGTPGSDVQREPAGRHPAFSQAARLSGRRRLATSASPHTRKRQAANPTRIAAARRSA